MIKNLPLPDLPDIGLTSWARAMPDECKTDDVVESYRRYYMMEKKSFCVWKGRSIPEWYIPNQLQLTY